MTTTSKTALAVLFLAVAPLLLAADTPGVALWPGGELKAYGKKLAPKMNAQKVAIERLASFGNHQAMVAYREGDGEAEWHETQADFFFVQSGQATLVVGGEVVDGKTTTPGEIRGTSIKGGDRHTLGPGDVVHIPAKTPHQLFLAKGAAFTYFVIKVDAP